MKEMQKMLQIAGIKNLNENAFSDSIFKHQEEFDRKESEIKAKLATDIRSGDKPKILKDLAGEAEEILLNFFSVMTDLDELLDVPMAKRFHRKNQLKWGKEFDSHWKEITGSTAIEIWHGALEEK